MIEPENAVRFRVNHQTIYRYHSAVTLLPHRLVLRPREWHEARLEDFSLAISPSARVEWSRDVHGNSIALASFGENASELSFIADFTIVRRRDPDTFPEREPVPGDFPVEYHSVEKAVVAAYQAPVFPEESSRITTWLGDLDLVRSGMPAVEVVLGLNRRIHESIRYRRREEKGTQSPDATLTLGTGSCRDKATLLMEALRHLGFATRFASGYLDCAATRAAQGSTHAWTEVYFPDLGWRGFDPTTGKRTTHQHIITGVSHHPRGVMPVAGSIIASPGSLKELYVNVSVSEWVPPHQP